ncbi:MAG: tRNA (adenosine(37)-N6)-threonylcarbamoyltransferase complex dimerization subunit type 1 TsaB [Bacteroidia bacterium]|nr:MAG: tRNA (adenosine(37)-N6)-threonylcarbamoyltransferase complex dimerization subunit type 1 TsaB [Bacteroidia bacterium]
MRVYSLHIETSTTLCSVALGINDQCQDVLEVDDGEFHSERLHLMIEELFRRNSFEKRNLDFISVSNGPGSYTGLRIGAATAKTIAYVLNIPLISISSLQTQVYAFLNKNTLNKKHIASIMPARGKKIYLGIYDIHGKEILSPQGLVVNKESLNYLIEQYTDMLFIGKNVENALKDFEGLTYQHFVNYSSQFMIQEAYSKYISSQIENLIYFEPLYI